MVIPWYWLVIVGFVSIFPGFIAIFLCQLWILKCRQEIDTLKHAMTSYDKRQKSIEALRLEFNEDLATTAKNFQNVVVRCEGVEQLVAGCSESIKNLSNKLAARDRTETRAKKREEADKANSGLTAEEITEAGGFPLTEQQNMFSSGGHGDFRSSVDDIPFGTNI